MIKTWGFIRDNKTPYLVFNNKKGFDNMNHFESMTPLEKIEYLENEIFFLEDQIGDLKMDSHIIKKINQYEKQIEQLKKGIK